MDAALGRSEPRKVQARRNLDILSNLERMEKQAEVGQIQLGSELEIRVAGST